MSLRAPLAALLLLLPATAAAQGVERIHATAQGEWARRGHSVAAARRVSGEAPARTAIEGTMRHAFVPVSFSDEGLRFSPDALWDRFYGPGSDAHASLPSYYSEASLDYFTIQGERLFEVSLPRPSSRYAGQRQAERFNGVADSLDVFLLDILDRLSGQVDWRAFVGPGETRVPALVLVTAGPGGNCTGDSGHIWPHRWHLTGLLGRPFRTSSLNENGDTILIDDYIVQPSEECGGAMAEVGVIAHETGHLLGLPDLYNTTDSGATSPVGDWGLMATGNYNRPSSPALPGAWTRSFTGWATVLAPQPGHYGEGASVELGAVQRTGTILRLSLPEPNEYFLIENRRRIGSDAYLHGEGLVVWYVNEDIVASNLDENTVNVDLSRPGVAVLPADGRRDMEEDVNNGDGGDVWPGSTGKTALGGSTQPSLSSPVSGDRAEWRLDSIVVQAQPSDGPVLFTLQATDATDSLNVLTVLPADFPPVVSGVHLEVALSVDRLPADSVSWGVDSAAVAALGLSFDAASATLSGRVPDSADGATFEVRAEAPDGRYGVRAYAIEVIPPPDFTAEDVVRAILDDAVSLPAEQVAVLDAYGNGNGRLDLGDAVRAFRIGLLDPNALRTLPPFP